MAIVMIKKEHFELLNISGHLGGLLLVGTIVFTFIGVEGPVWEGWKI